MIWLLSTCFTYPQLGGDLAGLGGVRDLRLPPAHHPQLLRQLLHLHVQGNFHYHTIPANDCFYKDKKSRFSKIKAHLVSAIVISILPAVHHQFLVAAFQEERPQARKPANKRLHYRTEGQHGRQSLIMVPMNMFGVQPDDLFHCHFERNMCLS